MNQFGWIFIFIKMHSSPKTKCDLQPKKDQINLVEKLLTITFFLRDGKILKKAAMIRYLTTKKF